MNEEEIVFAQNEELFSEGAQEGFDEETEDPSPSPAPELEEISERVERIDTTLAHPLLTTPLEDYTVTEGLLLGLLISILAIAVIHLVRRAFSWL